MIKGCGGICEIVRPEEFQLNPCFHIHAKMELDKSFDETIMDDIETDIEMYLNAENYKSNRDSR